MVYLVKLLNFVKIVPIWWKILYHIIIMMMINLFNFDSCFLLDSLKCQLENFVNKKIIIVHFIVLWDIHVHTCKQVTYV